jgi:hypothetical protein
VHTKLELAAANEARIYFITHETRISNKREVLMYEIFHNIHGRNREKV